VSEKQAITYHDAATILGVSPRTIRRWVAFGLLPVIRVTQRTVFICRKAVEGLIRSPLPWTPEDAKVLFAHKRS
jgi:excisionase family DNA binding protein